LKRELVAHSPRFITKFSRWKNDGCKNILTKSNFFSFVEETNCKMSGGVYGGDEVGALVFDPGHFSFRWVADTCRCSGSRVVTKWVYCDFAKYEI